MQAFITYPEWGLPVLRNSIKTPESDNHSWQIAMLIGMLGDASDIPLLLTRWRQLDKHERSEVWLGAMQRLYWKNYEPSEIIPKLKSLSVKSSKNVAEGDKDSNNQSCSSVPPHSSVLTILANSNSGKASCQIFFNSSRRLAQNNHSGSYFTGCTRQKCSFRFPHLGSWCFRTVASSDSFNSFNRFLAHSITLISSWLNFYKGKINYFYNLLDIVLN